MKFIFSTGSLYTYSTARCFEFAAQAGFDGIELMVDHRWDTRQSDYLLRLIDSYQLPILAVHSPQRVIPLSFDGKKMRKLIYFYVDTYEDDKRNTHCVCHLCDVIDVPEGEVVAGPGQDDVLAVRMQVHVQIKVPLFAD